MADDSTQYALWFIPEQGIEQPPHQICAPVGRKDAFADLLTRAQDEWGSSDWLHPDNADSYGVFVNKGRTEAMNFLNGFTVGCVVLVPYGSLVITG